VRHLLLHGLADLSLSACLAPALSPLQAAGTNASAVAQVLAQAISVGGGTATAVGEAIAQAYGAVSLGADGW
jgi:hypothetical protein